MATISFHRPITVNEDWGVKNFEDAIRHPVNIEEILKNSPRRTRMATEEDYRKLKEKLSK